MINLTQICYCNNFKSFPLLSPIVCLHDSIVNSRSRDSCVKEMSMSNIVHHRHDNHILIVSLFKTMFLTFFHSGEAVNLVMRAVTWSRSRSIFFHRYRK